MMSVYWSRVAWEVEGQRRVRRRDQRKPRPQLTWMVAKTMGRAGRYRQPWRAATRRETVREVAR